jgi:hypothetical protein
VIFPLCYSLHNNNHMEEFQSTNNNVLDNGVGVNMCAYMQSSFHYHCFYGFVLHYCAWSSFNHVRLIILAAFLSSEQAHVIVVTFFWSFFCVVVHGHFLVIYLHCCAVCSCTPHPPPHFYGVWACKDGVAKSAKFLQCH